MGTMEPSQPSAITLPLLKIREPGLFTQLGCKPSEKDGLSYTLLPENFDLLARRFLLVRRRRMVKRVESPQQRPTYHWFCTLWDHGKTSELTGDSLVPELLVIK